VRVLAVGAHPDDVELGCGATLARHVLAGDEAFVLVLGAGALSRDKAQAGDTLKLRRAAIDSAKLLGVRVAVLSYPDQRFDSVDFLLLVKSVESVIEQVQPERVYTHHGGDLNLDHRITHQAVLTACRPTPGHVVKRIEAFEVPSTTEWALEIFRPTSFVDVTGDALQRKLLALACYSTEMRDAPHPRSPQAIRALAHWRGATAGVHEAEAFSLVREIR
jgi:N-acetylglucosamine malate deacetylase 1